MTIRRAKNSLTGRPNKFVEMVLGMRDDGSRGATMHWDWRENICLTDAEECRKAAAGLLSAARWLETGVDETVPVVVDCSANLGTMFFAESEAQRTATEDGWNGTDDLSRCWVGHSLGPACSESARTELLGVGKVVRKWCYNCPTNGWQES